MNDMAMVLEVLEALVLSAERSGAHTLARELREERIPALRKGAVQVVVLGEFNHGKSTLINALLGTSLLPVGITPTTACITRIESGPAGQAAVHFHDGRVEAVSLEALEAVVTREDDAVQQVVVYHAGEVLAEQVVVIDTPGVNDISRQRVEVTYGIVPRADVVLFVLDATQVLKRTEMSFIEKRLLGGMRDRLVFVLNKMDRLDAEEAEEVESYVRERLEQVLGTVALFRVSARQGVGAGDQGVAALRTHLRQHLAQARDVILLGSAVNTGLRAANVLLGSLRIKRSGYKMQREELSARVEVVRGKLEESERRISQNVDRIADARSTLVGALRHNVGDFRDAFMAALPREIEKVAVADVQRYLEGFIEETCKRFVEREGGALARALEALAEEVIAVTNENMRQAVALIEGELGSSVADLDVAVNTTPYDFSVFAMGAFGVSVLVFVNVLVGGVIALATPVVAFVLRDRLDTKVRARATEAGLEAIGRVCAKIEEELVAIVETFTERLRAFVEDAGHRLYRQIEEALQAALRDKNQNSQGTVSLEADLVAEEERVRQQTATLSTCRAQTWAAV